VSDRSTKPTAAQAAFGTVAWLILTTVALWWSSGETEPGNRFFLWAVAVMAFGFAIWRAVVTIRTISA
jgi:apolipoprotein N-acyltransferase